MRLCIRFLCLIALFGAAVTTSRAQTILTECTPAALEAAIAEGGEIILECDGIITLTNTLVITTDTTLDATGHNVVISTLTGTNATNAVRLFEIEPDIALTLIHLRLANGRGTNGAAIYNNAGLLFASSCVFSNNQALGFNGRDGRNGKDNETDSYGGDGQDAKSGTAAAGGALYNLGVASLESCAFVTNAVGGGNGGNGGNGGAGFYLGGDGGRGGKGGAAFGGAVYNAGELYLSTCSFRDNFVVGGTGGTGGAGGAARSGGANGRGGGGGTGQGGAIYNDKPGYVETFDSTFAFNQSEGGDSVGGGSGYGKVPSGMPGGQGLGGAVCNFGESSLENCTFFGNLAAGGAGGDGTDSTFKSGNGGNGGSAYGGGVYNYRRLTALNCTFSDGGVFGGTNGLAGSADFPGKDGKKGVAKGGNIANGRGSFYLQNCIIAYGAPGTNGNGGFVDEGYNISSDRSIRLRGPGSLMNTNPLIGVLANNGGPTDTLALLPGSPAIDRGDPAFVLPIDQRGVPRPYGDRGDIGAYEYGVFLTAPVILVHPQNAQAQLSGSASFGVEAAGDPPLLYQWRRNSSSIPGATSATFSIDNVQAGDAGNYDVLVSNNSGSVTSGAAALTVLRPVTITQQPSSMTVTPGATVVFRVAAAGDPTIGYQWFFKGIPILGATLNTLTLTNVQPEISGDYEVLVFNSFSSVTSDPATLTVATMPPGFLVEPADVTVASGEDATFTATVDGTPPFRFLWYFNGTTLVGQTSSEDGDGAFTLVNAQLEDDGPYTLVVTNYAGSVTSEPFALNVALVPPTITQPLTNITISTGEDAVFSIGISGSAPRFYQWYFNDTSLVAASTNATLVITNAQFTNAGSYHVVVTNIAGAVTSAPPAVLQVVDSAPFDLQVTPDLVITNTGRTVEFTVTASGSRPFSYQWFLNSVAIANATNAVLTLDNVTVDLEGDYAVQVSNAFGSMESLPAALFIEDSEALRLEGAAAVTETHRPRTRRR